MRCWSVACGAGCGARPDSTGQHGVDAARVVSFGDQDDAASLVDAFRGAAALFVVATYDQASGGTDAEARRGRTIAESAAAAGCTRVVYSSVGGAERHTGIPHFNKRRVEERLQN